MTEHASQALRAALNRMDTMRRRSLWMTRFLLAGSILFLVLSFPILLFRGFTQLGIFCCTVSLFSLIGALGINVEREISSHTTMILRAIEGLHGEQQQ